MPVISGSSGGAAGPYTSISAASPSGAATVSFSGLVPAPYTFFVIEWYLCTSNAADQHLVCQVNGDSTAGHYNWGTFDKVTSEASGSDTSAVLGWVPASSQSFGAGRALIPAQNGASTRCGASNYGCNGTTGVRVGTATQTLTFSIAANVTSILVFAAAGNLTGHVTLYGA